NCRYCGAALFSEKAPLDVPEKNSLDEKVLELVKAERRLEAVKLYKDSTGLGLKEAKDYVDALATKNGMPPPAGCFVATACYGDYNAPEVLVLRNFRDGYLLHRAWGRFFVKFYYRFSPPAARVLERSAFLRKAIRKIVLAPFVKAVQKGHHQ
ncbi:MAG TPA: CFI-box-CTERM domain-containing protein, partial [Bacteroidia bacterium]